MTVLFHIKKKAVLSGLIKYSDLNYWEIVFLVSALLFLIAAVIISLIHKRLDVFRKKRSFNMYVHSHFVPIFNFLENESLEYQETNSTEIATKEQIALSEFLKRFENDFKHQKDAVKPIDSLTLLINLQSLLLFSFRLRMIVQEMDVKALKDRTLVHGSCLSKKVLCNIYQFITVLDRFVSNLEYHDRFGQIKSIQRLTQMGVWIGIEVHKDYSANPSSLHKDMLWVNKNEASIAEIAFHLRKVKQMAKAYADKAEVEHS